MTDGLAPDAGAPAPAPALRPLGIGEQLDVALKICTTHWRPLLKAVLVPVIPAGILTTLLTLSTLPDDSSGSDVLFGPDTTTASGDDLAAAIGGQLVGTLVTILVTLLVFGACFRIVAEAYVGAGPEWRASLRYAARRALPLLWLSLVYSLGVLLGFIALIIPGIWLSVAWALSYPALFAEDARGTQALRRAFRLVRKRWWPTAAVLGIGYLIATVLALIGTFAAGLIFVIDIDSLLFGAIVATFANVVSQAISSPIIAAVLAVAYFDLRVRKEGFDLELLAQRIGTRRATASPAERPARPSATGPDQPPYWPPPPDWQPGGRP